MDDEQPTAAEAEFFPTPAWVVHRLLEAVPLHRMRSLLDPCVGGNAIPEAIRSFGYSPMFEPPTWTTLDIRDTGYADRVCDYTTADLTALGKYQAAVFNPPFTKALQFVQQALWHCGMVVMLQKLNWLASDERQKWLQANPPDAQYVLPNRADFDGRGGDSCDYAWFVWGGGYSGIHILNITPLEVRKAQKPGKRAKAQMGLFP